MFPNGYRALPMPFRPENLVGFLEGKPTKVWGLHQDLFKRFTLQLSLHLVFSDQSMVFLKFLEESDSRGSFWVVSAQNKQWISVFTCLPVFKVVAGPTTSILWRIWEELFIFSVLRVFLVVRMESQPPSSLHVRSEGRSICPWLRVIPYHSFSCLLWPSLSFLFLEHSEHTFAISPIPLPSLSLEHFH